MALVELTDNYHLPPNPKEHREFFLVVEKQILRNLASSLRDSVEKISEYPSATHLLPVCEALVRVNNVADTLERISK